MAQTTLIKIELKILRLVLLKVTVTDQNVVDNDSIVRHNSEPALTPIA